MSETATRSFQARKANGNACTVWIVNVLSELPVTNVAEGDVGFVLDTCLFYERLVNTSGWTLVFDATVFEGTIDAGNVTGLQAAVEGFLVDELAGKANVSHTHAQSDITNLVSDLAGKAASVHTHSPSAITFAATDRLLGRVSASGGAGEEVVFSDFAQTLLDDADAAAARTTLSAAAATHTHVQADVTGLTTTDSPQFAAVNIGAATDTTITRTGAGDIAVEGNAIYRAGGIDVPVTDGGTGASTATAAFDNLAPTTTQGDIIYHNGTDNVRLAKGTGSQFLRMNSGATAPEWTTASMLIYAGAGDTGGYNPAAGTNFYFGIQTGLDPNTTDGGPGFAVPVSGTINYCHIKQSTLGTNGINGENIVYRLRKNATTDSDIVATLDTDVDNVEGSNSALGFAVSAGDVVAIKGTPPAAWTTPPTIMFWTVTMRLDVP